MSVLRLIAAVAALAALCSVTACGGAGAGGADDGGGGNLLLGQSQDPDPVVVDVPFAYIRRVAPAGMAFKTIAPRAPLHFQPGADLIVADRAAPGAPRRNISQRAFVDPDATPETTVSTWDVRDLNVSPDGRLLVFAMRAPALEDADDDQQPTWNLWTYDPAADLLARVFAGDAEAEAGEDVMPAFLPDGRIVFASSRQRRARAILLDEGKPQYSRLDEAGSGTTLNLHVVEPDGTNLRQITFNPSHDLAPSILQDGRLVYVRWDRAPGNDGISIYRTNPDGHGNELLYGFHSHHLEDLGAVEFGAPRALPDGRLLVRLQPTDGALLGQADLLIVDPAAVTDLGVPVFTNAGAQEMTFKRLVPREVRLDDALSTGGRYLDAWPLFDGTGRLLVSWSQCRQLRLDASIGSCVGAGEGAVEAEPVFGIFVYDPADDTHLPLVVPQSGVAFTDPVALAPLGSPGVLIDAEAAGTLDADLVAAEAGVLNIRSVYDSGGEDTSAVGYRTLADPGVARLSDRPVAFVRLLKQVAQPPRDVLRVPGFAFGPQRNLGQREILGYAPVHPDGSVMVRVPADVPFTLELLDASGARVSARRQYWLDVRPGEVLACNGCHAANDTRPHGRLDAEPPSINAGGPFVNVVAALSGAGGQTLAEAFAAQNGVPDPDFDVRFDDVWTDPAVRAPDVSFAFNYADLATAAPVTASCGSSWSARCRAVIHYAEHIQPLFDLPRITLDADGMTVIEDRTCTSCHGRTDADGLAMVPAAQLELLATASDQNADQLTGYRELLFGDNELEVVDGVVGDRLVQAVDGAGNPRFETDEDGALILDADGNPIPVLVPVRVSAPASANGARASTRLFAPFAAGASHDGFLSPAELRLLREWLDIGAQYLNDPFAVEVN